MIHLREIHLRDGDIRPTGFPFNLDVIQKWSPLILNVPVTILVGENGSGKSTILEGIACAAEMITVGSGAAHRDPTLEHVHEFARWLKLVWNKRTRKGFFLRAEDFFGFVKRQAQSRIELEKELERVQDEYEGRSKLAQNMARMPFAGQIGAMQERYGTGLDAQSHGESFLALFQARFVPGGLYLLDEPEAPLSPLRQMALLSAIKDMVEQDSQFIIATHAPILMAYPGAEILSLDQHPISPVTFQSLEHVNLMRDFLNDPDAFLRHL